MNGCRTLRPQPLLAIGWLLALLFAGRCQAVEPNRVWVDSRGLFSVTARLIELSDGKAVLLRDNGRTLSVEVDQLSDGDQKYLAEVQQRAKSVNRDRRASTPPEYPPLPELDLPPAATVAETGSTLSWQGRLRSKLTTTPPKPLVPDPTAAACQAQPAHIRLYNVRNNDHCSRPMPILVSSDGRQQRTFIGMSISSDVRFPGERGANQLIRFDVERQKAIGVFDHDAKIRLLDHHLTTGRSLLLVGFNSLGKDGELCVGTGWDRRFRLSQARKMSGPYRPDVPTLRWARWVDDEHFVAVIDQTLGLWNIVSGEQLYQIDGIDRRALPAISAGRRLLAIPYEGEAQLLATATGQPLGRIEVSQSHVPGVSFSPTGDQLALAASRRLKIWSLPLAKLAAEIECQRSFGSGQPNWIDSDLILSSTGVLASVRRELPIWRYDLAAADTIAVGNHVAMFRKHPKPVLSVVSMPHTKAANAIHWIDRSPAGVDKGSWRILGQSIWNAGGWDDRDVEISAAPTLLR